MFDIQRRGKKTGFVCLKVPQNKMVFRERIAIVFDYTKTVFGLAH
jgi:hypothetical protein